MSFRFIHITSSLFFGWLLILAACHEPEPFPATELDDRMSGGDHTHFDAGSGAYGHTMEGLSLRDLQVHSLGDRMFETAFVPGPAPQLIGLGPLYNQKSCAGCHQSEGRGRVPESGSHYESMFFKISMPGMDEHGSPLPVPGFGMQIQDRSIFGAEPEAKVEVTWEYAPFTFPDGEEITLRKPRFQVIQPYMPFPAHAEISPRLARPLVGMGLIEAIEEESIMSHADPSDADGDGISGRPNWVYDFVNAKKNVLGRIGWKASVPDIKGQIARALNEDIGVTNAVFPQKNAEGQRQMAQAWVGSQPDLPDSALHALVFYMQTLSVPARRDVQLPDVRDGKAIFSGIGCQNCHVDVHTTRVDVRFKPLSGQIIRPYSDFLLHDMGPDLADNRPEYAASGQEWRTPPLWGIGLSKKVSGHDQLLHDGRARGFKEAILWHGGEAETVKQRFMRLPAISRKKLIRFLESL